jgi:phosphodiesterase/alkaline phosphatase D-like protein
VLRGEVRPGTARSRYYFEYGMTKRYGRRTPRGHAAAGGKTISVRARVRGLRSNTTYHYRLVAENYSGQTTFARDRSFHTSSSAACGASPVARPPHTPWGFTG